MSYPKYRMMIVTACHLINQKAHKKQDVDDSDDDFGGADTYAPSPPSSPNHTVNNSEAIAVEQQEDVPQPNSESRITTPVRKRKPILNRQRKRTREGSSVADEGEILDQTVLPAQSPPLDPPKKCTKRTTISTTTNNASTPSLSKTPNQSIASTEVSLSQTTQSTPIASVTKSNRSESSQWKNIVTDAKKLANEPLRTRRTARKTDNENK